jgi:hypothetical protein
MRILGQIRLSKFVNIREVKFSKLLDLTKYQFLYFLFFAIQQSLNWPLLKFFGWRGPIHFWDTKAILASADCYSSVGLAVFNVADGDPCTGYIYGSFLLRLLTFLNLGESRASLFGWTFLTVLSIIFGFLTFLLRLSGFCRAVFLYLIFINPPIFLLIERGNFDSLIFIFFFTAVIFHSYGYKFVNFLIILTISTWKFYTFPLAILALFAIEKAYLRIIGSVLMFLGIVQAIKDLSFIPSISVAVADGSFGVQVWGSYLNRLNITSDVLSSYVFGVTILLTTFCCLLFFKSKIVLDKRVFLDSGARQRFSSSLFQSSFVVFFSCYMVGINYDYRLIFLSATSIGFVLLGNDFQKLEFIQGLVCGLTILCMWFSYNSNLLQPIGDFAMVLLACIFAVNLARLHLAFSRDNLEAIKERIRKVLRSIRDIN